MGETKPKVTLIGSVLARTGLEFVYEGTIPECGACSLRKACNNLKAGKRYRITGVRPTQHSCPVHMDGALVVEVVEAPIAALINADMAIKNGRILFESPCTKGGCTSYDLCHPDGVIEGEKYTVTEVLGNAPEPCERGRAMKLVHLLSA